MDLVIEPTGTVRCIYAEQIDISCLGPPLIVRASHVEPDATGHWWADLAPVGGPRLGPYSGRTQALDAEQRWLEANWLLISQPKESHDG